MVSRTSREKEKDNLITNTIKTHVERILNTTEKSTKEARLIPALSSRYYTECKISCGELKHHAKPFVRVTEGKTMSKLSGTSDIVKIVSTQYCSSQG